MNHLEINYYFIIPIGVIFGYYIIEFVAKNIYNI